MTKLQRLRQKRCTLRQLSDEIGMSAASLSRMERGIQPVPLHVARELCRIFPGISMAYLAKLGGKK